MAQVKTLILRAPGTNCDAETAFAFEQAGSLTELVHVNELINQQQRLSDYQILVIPGGFTYGDDIAAGKILANELKAKLGEDISKFVASGGLILGICNGFQVLAKIGILPVLSRNETPYFTLTNNDSGKFECRWVYLQSNEKSSCVFTQGIGKIYLPVAHGEGKAVIEPGLLPRLNVALCYSDASGSTDVGYPDNPNGSVAGIAGISDDTGRILGLMPHPERHIRGTQHPQWTRNGAKNRGDGFQIFLNAVKWAKGS
jgi:phosphoribosylformylglycinamidine synthase subunit PurQ / glutaminase